MARILALSSQTIFGAVGNSVAVPALQSLGHAVMSVPTILLSNHPGLGTPVVQHIAADVFENLIVRATALQVPDAVMTGYFASPEQVLAAANYIKASKPALVLVDPVMGDHGKLYVADATARAICEHLVPLGDILTPNNFELSLIAQDNAESPVEIEVAARRIGAKEIIVTSVPAGELLSTLAFIGDTVFAHHQPKLPHVPNGTGDLLASLYLGHRLQTSAALAFTATMKNMERAVATSTGQLELNLPKILSKDRFKISS